MRVWILAGLTLAVGCSAPPFETGPELSLPAGPVPVTHDEGVDATVAAAVEERVVAYMEDDGPPGLGVALVRDGAVLYAGGYGWADVEDELPLGPRTSVLLSSVSKTFIGVAAMQAVDEGRLQLDQPLTDVLPFTLDGPSDAPITFRHVLTHHSGIRDTVEYGRAYAEGDPTVGLGEFLESYLVRGGSRWRSGSFAGHEPGDRFAYSNVGAALAGFAVGEASGTSFASIVFDEILLPLGMNDSAYYLSDLVRSPAVPYDRMGDGLAAWPQYGYPTYPDGMMRSSARDMARYVAAMVDGELEGTRILEESTAREMVTVDPALGTDEDGQAIAWAMRRLEGRPLVGHNGLDYGSLCELWFDPETGDGFVLLLNGFPGTSFGRLIDLEADLFALAEG
ncbi:MAG: serine hydrolase domain-containing protein [Myxococcota bacterium]